MVARRLLQATCLLLLSAAVLGHRNVLQDDGLASITAVEPMAAMPAEISVAATECAQKYGRNNCAWNSTVCMTAIPGCLLCERPSRNDRWECAVCRPGNFQNGRFTCTTCPNGHYCGGIGAPKQCEEGKTTSATGRPAGNWAADQCDSCLPGYGYHDHDGGECHPCQPGTFKTRISQDACSACPDGLIANSVAGATECVPAALPGGGTGCLAPTVPVLNLRSCGCPPGSAVAGPSNAAFAISTGIWWQLRNNQTFDTPIRMPSTNALTPFPVGCAPCTGRQTTSLNNPTTAGAYNCQARCPANSRPNLAGEGGNPTLPARATCVCLAGFKANGVNSAQCTTLGLQCPTAPSNGITVGGCIPVNSPPTPPGNPPPSRNNDDDDEDEEQEWGHWSKKHHKHHEHHDDDGEDGEDDGEDGGEGEEHKHESHHQGRKGHKGHKSHSD